MRNFLFNFYGVIPVILVCSSFQLPKDVLYYISVNQNILTTEATPTWYLYTGAQTPLERAKKANYVKTLVTPVCPQGAVNECAVLLSDDFGITPLSAIISFDTGTGMPLIAGDVLQNRTKGP